MRDNWMVSARWTFRLPALVRRGVVCQKFPPTSRLEEDLDRTSDSKCKLVPPQTVGMASMDDSLGVGQVSHISTLPSIPPRKQRMTVKQKLEKVDTLLGEANKVLKDLGVELQEMQIPPEEYRRLRNHVLESNGLTPEQTIVCVVLGDVRIRPSDEPVRDMDKPLGAMESWSDCLSTIVLSAQKVCENNKATVVFGIHMPDPTGHGSYEEVGYFGVFRTGVGLAHDMATRLISKQILHNAMQEKKDEED